MCLFQASLTGNYADDFEDDDDASASDDGDEEIEEDELSYDSDSSTRSVDESDILVSLMNSVNLHVFFTASNKVVVLSL